MHGIRPILAYSSPWRWRRFLCPTGSADLAAGCVPRAADSIPGDAAGHADASPGGERAQGDSESISRSESGRGEDQRTDSGRTHAGNHGERRAGGAASPTRRMKE